MGEELAFALVDLTIWNLERDGLVGSAAIAGIAMRARLSVARTPT